MNRILLQPLWEVCSFVLRVKCGCIKVPVVVVCLFFLFFGGRGEWWCFIFRMLLRSRPDAIVCRHILFLLISIHSCLTGSGISWREEIESQ